MKRQELIVLLMIAEGRTDELFQFIPRELIGDIHDELVKRELLEPPKNPAVLSTNIADRGRLFLETVDRIPLPQKTWTMGPISGD